METFSALLALCAGNSPATGEFPSQRPVMGSFDVFYDLRLNKRWSKQSWGWWFETPSCPLWRHRNDMHHRARKTNRALTWEVSIHFADCRKCHSHEMLQLTNQYFPFLVGTISSFKAHIRYWFHYLTRSSCMHGYAWCIPHGRPEMRIDERRLVISTSLLIPCKCRSRTYKVFRLDITVPTNGLASTGARPFAGTMLTVKP